ncbi:hypothetical protein V1281_007823 [Nitrobacteraceae bacterium AZCC 2161]
MKAEASGAKPLRSRHIGRDFVVLFHLNNSVWGNTAAIDLSLPKEF